MKKLKILFMLIFFITLTAFGNQRRLMRNETRSYYSKIYAGKEEIPYTGIIYNLYKSGKLNWETNYVNGLRDGKDVTYFEDGSIKTEGAYKNDKAVGETKTYHLNGKLYILKSHDDNGKVTSIKRYDDKGVIKSETKYVNEKRSESISYKNGKIDNKMKFLSGGKVEITKYVNGKAQKPEIWERPSQEELEKKYPGIYFYFGKD